LPAIAAVLITAGMPPLLADIVADGLGDEVRVERVEGPEGLERSRAAVVLASAEWASADEIEALLRRRPEVRLFVIAADGRTTWLWRLRPDGVPLGELTPPELAAAIHREMW
jgi:hypothetical protein